MSSTTHPPTPQQSNVYAKRRTGKNLVVLAGAGAGKTSTLDGIAREAKEEGLVGAYICFNGSTAKEAQGRFPSNVQCGTAHSFAAQASGRYWHHRLRSRETGRGTQGSKVVAGILGINDPLILPSKRFTPAQVAWQAMRTVTAWCKTADDVVGPQHVPHHHAVDDADRAAHIAGVLPWAEKAIADLRAKNGLRNDLGNCLNIEHDHYLKFLQVAHRQIMVRIPGRGLVVPDFIMFDEGQDAQPAMAGIFLDQYRLFGVQLILVGDRSQAINGWAGAIDITGDVPDAQFATLSKSFRFGPAVAHEANKWLTLLGADLRITGHDPVESVLGKMGDPDVILCRTNGGGMRAVLAEHEAGRKVHMVGNGDEIKRLAEAALELEGRGWTSHPDLNGMTSWAQVVSYCAEGELGTEDLQTDVALIDEFGAEDVIAAVDQLVKDPRRADVTVCTAHKAKGLEWDAVRIADDFRGPRVIDGEEILPDREELMLAYVAITRAKLRLDPGSLDWIDRWIDKHHIVVEDESPEPAYGDLDAPAVEPVELRPLPSAPLARAVELLRRHEQEVMAREFDGRPGFDDAERAETIRGILSAYLDRDVRDVLAEESAARAS